MEWRGIIRVEGSKEPCPSIYRLRLLNNDGMEAVYYEFRCNQSVGHIGNHTFNPTGEEWSLIAWFNRDR